MTTRLIFTLLIIFLSFFLQTFRIFSFAGVQANFLLITLVTIVLASRNIKKHLPSLILLIVGLSLLVITLFPFFLKEILVMESLIFLLFLMKNFLTGTFIVDLLISLTSINLAFYLTLNLTDIHRVPWNTVTLETVYNLFLAIAIWYLFIYRKFQRNP